MREFFLCLGTLVAGFFGALFFLGRILLTLGSEFLARRHWLILL